MKKLLFVFMTLFVLVLISGCNSRQSVVRFDNNEETTETIEEASETASEEASEVTEETVSQVPKGKLAVTSFEGAFLKTHLNYNIVKGSASSNTHSIKVNDYSLQKYFPGQTEWSYIAATNYGTLKDGLNSYVVKTYDAKGTQIDSLIFTIDYDAPEVPVLPGVGVNHWLTLLFSMIAAGSYTLLRKLKSL